jgi:2-oxoglutarate ferredoxin oxidoreductase subunit alpha
MGAIEEAVDRCRDAGEKVSSVHLRFLSPLEPGLKEIFSRYKKVITVEINYSDDPNAPMITAENRRYSQLAWLLRAQTLLDIDCWSQVYGQPLQPGAIHEELKRRLNQQRGED